MRFIIIVKGHAATPEPSLTAAMAAYHEELARAGVLLDAGAYTLIEVASREAALEWSRRFPAPSAEGQATEIEVRQLIELDELQTGGSIERFRALEPGIA
jgi:hypothetical protein